MDFAARTAWTGLAHHPEIVFFVPEDDVRFRVESFLVENFGPDVVRFLIEIRWLARAGFINSGVKAVGGKFPDLRQQLPSPFIDSFLK